MKRIFCVSLFFALSGFIFAQNGYKEYIWGMTVSQVKAICTDLVVYPHANTFTTTPRNVVMYLYNTQLGSKILSDIPDPLRYEAGNITSGTSKQNNLSFSFLNDKLIAVEVSFGDRTNILSELERQYGKVNPISWLNGRNRTASWNSEANRVINWLSTGYENVTYIDKNWLTPLINKAMDEYRKRQ